jgi:CheY-like chemotaxis protein
MKRSSEESVKAKTGFLANLSHEIRGPLGIMLNAVELVLDGLCGPVSSDQLDTLKMVKTNGDHLLELINDVLDFAKVEAGKIKPEGIDILANDLLQDVCAVVRTQADAKGHRLQFRAGTEALAFHCDRRHARQMLINLLTNAIKYTPDGGTIEVWAERSPRNRVKLNVKDSGVGIAPADHAKVFAAFERVDHAYSVKQVGTGLGMPLTKRLAEVNGGTIEFTSALGKGTHFWLQFNAVEAIEHVAVERQIPERPVVGAGDVVMLVQADQQERSMVARYLSHVGFSVIQASSAPEVESLLEGHTVSLALIDNDVADQPDHGVIKSVQARKGRLPIPIVITSSRAFVFDIERYLKGGIDRCLVKPLELAAVAKTCRELIDATRKGAALSAATPTRLANSAVRVPRSDDIVH